MTQPATPTAVLHFAPLTTEHVKAKTWVAAAFLGVALLGAATVLLKHEGTSIAEATVSYDGSGLLDSHQIVALVSTTILQHSEDAGLSKQIASRLIQDDRSGTFDRAQTPKQLASLLTQRIQQVSHDSRYQVSYSAAPPDIAEAHGSSIYRISQHLSVALPSV
jgi:hypothetical protein